MDYDFRSLAEQWPSPIVAKTQIEKFSGGLLNARSMANLDSLKLVPAYFTPRIAYSDTIGMVVKWDAPARVVRSSTTCRVARAPRRAK